MSKGPKPLCEVGDFISTTKWGMCQVVEYNGSKNILVKFLDGTLVRTRTGEIKSGAIRNPNVPSVFGVGYIGQGRFTSSLGKGRGITPHYNTWAAMLNRCYSKSQPASYAACYVDAAWYNFQNFAEWYDENYVDEWELDKDLLGNQSSCYSKDTCCFLPKEINNILRKKKESLATLPRGVQKLQSGSFSATSSAQGESVYLGSFLSEDEAWLAVKEFVELKIKNLADKYKDKLASNVYHALYNIQYRPFNDEE